MKKNILFSALISACLLTTSCRDQFADVNTNPSEIETGVPSYIFAQGVMKFEPQDYTYWFYNGSSFYQWVQTGVPTGSVGSTYADGAPLQQTQSIKVLTQKAALKFTISKLEPELRPAYQVYEAALDILCVYMGIFDSDFIGDIPYTEGGKGRPEYGGILNPKFDRVADLYQLWLKDLDKDVDVLLNAEGQLFEAAQDPVYNGNRAKWARLANSLKLKIAARLISQDLAQAKKIAEDVLNSPAGVMSGTADDFLFNKATGVNTEGKDPVYHWGNDVMQSIAPSETLVNFMVENKDPRVRFIYTKNSWNSEVLQQFLDSTSIGSKGFKGKVPDYIMDKVDYTVDSKGRKVFKSWKAPGEPWVRYYGLPQAYEANQDAAKYGDWYSSDRYKLNDTYSYRPYSMFNQQMLRGQAGYSYPNVPAGFNDKGEPIGTGYVEPTRSTPWWGIYMTTAEVNLYLAEFKLLGANLPKSAADYFAAAIPASVEEYNKLAINNQINYTEGTPFVFFVEGDEPINLKDGEIDELMSSKAYQLTGDVASDLEKVYLQQIFHFQLQPIDMFVTARRSGVPMNNSTLFPRVVYSQVPNDIIPRRMALNALSPETSGTLYQNLKESYEVQGYTPGSDNGILNTQRVWQDKGAPQFGQGPLLQ